MTKEYNSRSILPPPERKLISYDKPQKEHNPPVFEGSQTWSDQVKVQSLGFDRLGHLWGCGPGGVIRWIITPTEIKYKIWQSEHGIAGNDTQCLIVVPDGRIVCGHTSGWISIFQNDNWKVISSGTHFPIRSLATAPDGAIFACTDIGLFDIDTEELDSNIPAPPICAGTAFDRFWIGTESGLFFKDNSGWQLLDMDKPFRVVKAMRYSGNRLWFSGFDGAAYLDSRGAVTRIPTNEPVCAVAPTGDKVLLATDDGVFVYTEASNTIQRMSHYPSRAVIVKDHEVIQTTPDNLLLVDHKNRKERWLLPDRENLPGEVRRVFEANGVTYIQCVDGSIWDDSKVGWTKVANNIHVPITGVVSLEGEIIVGFMSRRGLAKVVNSEIEYFSELSYVKQLQKTDSQINAVTLDGVYETNDGIQWRKSPISTELAAKLGVPKRIQEKSLIFERAVCRLDDINFQINLDKEIIETAVIEIDSSIIVATAESLFCFEGVSVAPMQNISGITDITCLARYKHQTWVGTNHGLWVLDSSNLVYRKHDSGLAADNIISISIIDGRVWIETSSGTTVILASSLEI